MKITNGSIYRISPPSDVWMLVSIETDAGVTGWGEITGNGDNNAASAIASSALAAMVGKDPLNMGQCMDPFYRFRYPPIKDKVAHVAWSGINQALWDISARSYGMPLYKMLGGCGNSAVRLYANLNRGLFKDRSAEALTLHATQALEQGFAMAKGTVFDEMTPNRHAMQYLEPGLKRLETLFKAVDSTKIAVDCHRRFAPHMGHSLLEFLSGYAPLYWVEDLLAEGCEGHYAALAQRHPSVTWAGGEELRELPEAMAFLHGPCRPDIFMPDVKFVCGVHKFMSLLTVAKDMGLRLSMHNPAGPIATAFSAHICAAAGADEPLEYTFKAVDERETLLTPREPIEHGVYLLTDEPGIGIAPSPRLLESFGERFEYGRWVR